MPAAVPVRVIKGDATSPQAIGDARTVLNVGAGTGSYEPPGRNVIAVEPSAVMRALRPADAAPCVAGVAERLPFKDRSIA